VAVPDKARALPSIAGLGSAERTERELDRGIEVEIGPRRPRLVEAVSERTPQGGHRVAQKLSLGQLELEAVHSPQRLVRRAQASGNGWLTASKQQSSGDDERPREGERVSNRSN
jgi:hypothetical protein